MNRRELLSMIAAFTGAAMVGAQRGIAYAPTETGPNIFAPGDAAFLDEVAEVILPATETPGAKAAGVGAFMTVFVSDCYTAAEQARFREGLDALKAGAEAKYGRPFLELEPEERREYLQAAAVAAAEQVKVVAAAKAAQPQAGADDLPALHWFTPIQQLSIFGFFTSEIGATEVLRYEAVPGRYDGDLAYAGEPAWAT